MKGRDSNDSQTVSFCGKPFSQGNFDLSFGGILLWGSLFVPDFEYPFGALGGHGRKVGVLRSVFYLLFGLALFLLRDHSRGR